MLALATEFATAYIVGTSPLGDLTYSVLSYVLTGRVLEDSVFFTE